MKIKVGDSVRVKEEYFSRGGQYGTVVDVFPSRNEVAIDFFCDVFGNPWGTPSIESWKISELDINE